MNSLQTTTLSIFLFLCSLTINAQSSITLGTGNSSGTSYPIASYYNSSATESIYLGSEIGNSIKITQIGYEKASGNSTLELQITVYMKTTTKTNHGSSNYTVGAADFSEYTLVYEGPLPNNASSGWMEVPLDTPFEFTDPAKNLSVLVIGSTCIMSGRPQFRYTSLSSRMNGAFDDGVIGCDGTASWDENATLKPRLERPNLKLTFETLKNEEFQFQNTVALTTTQEQINIQSNATMQSVSVYDLSGRLIYDKSYINTTQHVINGLTAAKQVLFLRIVTESDTIITKKILF